MKFQRDKNHHTKIAIIGTLVLIAWLLAGCSQLEQKQADLQLICEPVEANGCIGFAKDKSIMLITEEEI
jgi:hypothetical protein